MRKKRTVRQARTKKTATATRRARTKKTGAGTRRARTKRRTGGEGEWAYYGYAPSRYSREPARAVPVAEAVPAPAEVGAEVESVVGRLTTLPNCKDEVNGDCTRCEMGYVPAQGPPNETGRRPMICKVAKGSAADLAKANPAEFGQCATVVAKDGDYTQEGYRADKPYDCTTCKDPMKYTPIGTVGNRRCQKMKVPVDLSNKNHCRASIGNDCTICDAGWVPAGPMFRRRCVKAGQMWDGTTL